ncbi:hypothetical protein D3C76_1552120 [compost metagenome]
MLADLSGDDVALGDQILGLVTSRHFFDDFLHGRVNDDRIVIAADIVHQIVGRILVHRIVDGDVRGYRLQVLGGSGRIRFRFGDLRMHLNEGLNKRNFEMHARR